MPIDDQKELFYWVDEFDNPQGSITRKQAHDGSRKIHRAVGVLLIKDNKHLLFQQRSKHKDTYPEYWTLSASGHVTYGQSYQEAAARELFEEIGIKPNNLKFIKKIYYQDVREREMDHIFSENYEGQQIIPDHTEVQQTKWVEIEKIKDFARENNISPYAIYALKQIGWL